MHDQNRRTHVSMQLEMVLRRLTTKTQIDSKLLVHSPRTSRALILAKNGNFVSIAMRRIRAYGVGPENSFPSFQLNRARSAVRLVNCDHERPNPALHPAAGKL